MHWPVAEDPSVRAQEIRVTAEHRVQMIRPCFLLTFEEELEIDRRRHSRSAKGVERGKHRDDGSLVIAG
jgi:hypothetical protein